jgi:hypothetical protein
MATQVLVSQVATLANPTPAENPLTFLRLPRNTQPQPTCWLFWSVFIVVASPRPLRCRCCIVSLLLLRITLLLLRIILGVVFVVSSITLVRSPSCHRRTFK